MHRILFALITAFGISQAATAEVINHRNILTIADRVPVTFGPEYEEKMERQLPFYFHLKVPRLDNEVTTQFRFSKEGNLALGRYVTPKGALAEFMTLSYGTIEPGTPEQRAIDLLGLIEDKVYPTMGLPPDAQKLGGRNATVAGHQAVEAIVLFEHPDEGLVFGRVMGVFLPQSHHVLFMVQQTVSAQITLRDPEDMAGTLVGEILNSVQFLGYRDESGAMVRY